MLRDVVLSTGGNDEWGSLTEGEAIELELRVKGWRSETHPHFPTVSFSYS